MGLRVATLVNLSFLGMDRLDSRLARFLAPASTARCIPEGVKRFTTWAPLLIPFYIPRGKDWDEAWSRSQALQAPTAGGGLMASISAPADPPAGPDRWSAAVLACTALFAIVRVIRARAGSRAPAPWSLANTEYEVTLASTGEVVGQTLARGYDVSRRSYDRLDPAGRALFVVDDVGARWPVVGNFPGGRAGAPAFGRGDDSLTVAREARRPPGLGRDPARRARRPGGGLGDHGREPVGLAPVGQRRPLPRVGPQQARRRPGPHPVQPPVRRDGVRRRPPRRPRLGQARQGDGRPGLRRRRPRAS